MFEAAVKSLGIAGKASALSTSNSKIMKMSFNYELF
jgi:hypothetical protein